MDSNRVLRAIDVSGLTLVAKGSLTTPDGGGEIFVGNGVAYVAGVFNFTGGYDTVNVSNPNSLTLIAASAATNTAASPNPYLVTNGSGLGIMAVAGGRGVSPSIDVFDTSDPTKTNQVLTLYSLTQPPLAVTVASGIAYVADGTNGLQVVNYEPFDNKGVAPTASIDTTGLDTNSSVAGIQVVEGSILPIKAVVADDVQVRNVALLVNGTVVQNAVSFPYNLTATMPTLASGATTATIQILRHRHRRQYYHFGADHTELGERHHCAANRKRQSAE